MFNIRSMKKSLLITAALLFLFQLNSRSDEGMWVPLFLESMVYEDMKEMGLKLTPDDIYSINNSSLKDAIVIFGRGCTGEIISDQGLLLTNHHCGYGRIQAHSSLEHDYLTEGFWAASYDEELPNPGLTATFLVRIEDVTEKIITALGSETDEKERSGIIRTTSGEIEKEATEGTHYTASVRAFYAGNEFYLFVYETFRDVRLVGAPPSSIGKFGADTDNWMWPRHTGDFSLFRVYTDKDGKPADYSEDNIPLVPKYYLPISLEGADEGDFSMILGYPGSTERYMTSYGVKMALAITNQTIVDIRDVKLKIMMEDMQKSDEVRIKYASKYARTSNYWKYYIGQTKGLKRLKVYDKKVALENEFKDWVAEDSRREEKYAGTLENIESAYDKISGVELARVYLNEAIQRGSEILGFASRFGGLKRELEADEPDQEKIEGIIESLSESADSYFKDYNLETDKKLLAAMLRMYHRNVPADQQPQYLKEINRKYRGDFEKYADRLFDKSVFANRERVEELLDNPKAKKIGKDPAYEAIKAFYDFYNEKVRPSTSEAYDLLDRGNRLYIAGLREMNPGKKYYPDANFTMRLTYGQVLDYYPADAVHYAHFTTLAGVMEKEDPSNWEFVVPEKLRELYMKKDYGRYGEDNRMKVCFLTNHDITGGNSGSPVINARGELIGLAFDGNWEAMSGDIAYEPELQRTISVDIRYVLFIIDKFAGASHLVDEMTLVSGKDRKNFRDRELEETSIEETLPLIEE